MKTPNRLFFNRLTAEFKYQYGVWRTAIDWTVALYIVIPTLYVITLQYINWWQMRPEWLKFFPYISLVWIIFIFTWSGKMRIFIEEADQLFLWQYPKWISRITGLSLGYSITANLIATLLLFVLLAPILRWYSLTWPAIAWLAIYTALLKNILGIVNRILALHLKGWLHRLVQNLVYIPAGIVYISGGYLLIKAPLFFVALSLLMLVVLVYLIKKRIRQKISFYEEIVLEQEIKLRYAVVLLRASGVHIKKAKSIIKKPLLFRSSGEIFKKRNTVNILTEACIKSVIRNKGHLSSYLQLLIVSIMFLLLMPTSWELVAWVVFALLLSNFVALYWREITDSPFVRLFTWEESDYLAAAEKSIFYLMLPGFLIISLIVGWQVFSWTGIPVFIALAVVGGRFLSQILATKY